MSHPVVLRVSSVKRARLSPVSILCLPDEALLAIFRELGRSPLFPNTDVDIHTYPMDKESEPSRAKNSTLSGTIVPYLAPIYFASCCKRLNRIYRSQIRVMKFESGGSVGNNKSLWERFPGTTDVDIIYGSADDGPYSGRGALTTAIFVLGLKVGMSD